MAPFCEFIYRTTLVLTIDILHVMN